MNLQTKMALMIIPLVMAAIIFLGGWSIYKSRESQETFHFLYLQTALDHFIEEEVTRRHELLKNNGLEGIKAFISQYQANAFLAVNNHKSPAFHHLMIFDDQGRLAFCGRGHKDDSVSPAWTGLVARLISQGKNTDIGHLRTSEGKTSIFAARHFKPWNWYVLLAIDEEQAHASDRAIRNATIGIMFFTGLTLIGLLWWLANRFFVQQFVTLGRAARKIGGGEPVLNIDVHSKDEFGEFARNMEGMSASIQEYREIQRRWQEKLEEQVEEKTSELTKEVKERQRTEEALKEREFILNGIHTSAPVGMGLVDLENKFHWPNQQLSRLTGYSLEELEGLSGHLLFASEPEYRQVMDAIWTDLNKTGSSNLEARWIRKDGRSIDVILGITFMDPDNPAAGLVSSALDITEAKQAEKEKSKLEAQLRQSQKMEAIGTLAGGVAHDFNNILSAVIGYAELALLDPTVSASIREDIEQIHKSGLRARNLVAQLLAYSRKQLLRMQSFPLNDLVKNNQAMLSRIIGEDVDVEFSLAGDAGLIRADFNQIEQVLLNLVANARDALRDGGSLVIETANVILDESYVSQHLDAVEGAYVMLAVSDNGPGMEKQTLENMFDPFFTTKGLGEGTGLGLATVHGIVKQHRGNIYVYSELGHGTTIKIYLPRVMGKMDELETETDLSNLVGGKETILVTEDEETVRSFIVQSLSGLGYRVLEAEDGLAGLNLVQGMELEIDLLVTDVIMPHMNGKKLYGKLKTLNPGLKILYISGYTDNVIAHHGVLDPDINFLQKPLQISVLAGKVRQVLDG